MTNSAYEEMFGPGGAQTGPPSDRLSTFPNYRTVPFGVQARGRALTVLKNRHAAELRDLYLTELEFLRERSKVSE